jgi:hypothetical protein
MLITYIIVAFKEIYSDYISTMQNIRFNPPNLMLHHNFKPKSNLISNYLLNSPIGKTSRFLEVNRE